MKRVLNLLKQHKLREWRIFFIIFLFILFFFLRLFIDCYRWAQPPLNKYFTFILLFGCCSIWESNLKRVLWKFRSIYISRRCFFDVHKERIRMSSLVKFFFPICVCIPLPNGQTVSLIWSIMRMRHREWSPVLTTCPTRDGEMRWGIG